METMEGLEFCNQVRRDEGIRNRAIPIIVLTGDQDILIHEVSRQVGATAVLAKPISADERLKQIPTAIGFSGDAPEPYSRPPKGLESAVFDVRGRRVSCAGS